MQNIKQKLTQVAARAAKFSGVGVVNTAVDFLIYSIMYSLFHASASLSQAIGYACGTVNSYFLNKHITFDGGTSHNREFVRFIFTNSLSLAVSTAAVWTLTDVFKADAYVAKICAIFTAQAINFTLYNLWVFKSKV